MTGLRHPRAMHLTRTQRVLTVLSLLLFGMACARDTGTGPDAASLRDPALVAGSLDRMYSVQLRAIPTDPIVPPNPIYGYGHLILRSGATLGDACVPPNPITPAPGFTLLTVCGRIFNEGGARYRGGAVYTAPDLGLGDGSVPILVAAFGGAHPSDPCRRYDIAGAVPVPDAVAADIMTNPSGYQVIMDGEVASSPTQIGGRFDGSAWGPVGTRAENDPFFAARVCEVTVTP